MGKKFLLFFVNPLSPNRSPFEMGSWREKSEYQKKRLGGKSHLKGTGLCEGVFRIAKNLLHTAIICFWLFALPISSLGQSTQPDSAQSVLLTAAREIISSTQYCALITIDSTGTPRVRMMDPFPPDSAFVIWFGTNPLSRKVSQIHHNPKATLYYPDPDNSGYVTLYGTANLVDDLAAKQKLWKEGWQAFYPDYPEGFMLIRFEPDWLEIVSVSRGIEGKNERWEPPRVEFERKR